MPGESEKFLTQEETLIWLKSWLNNFETLPLDLKDKNSLEKAAQHLLDTACELQIKKGFTIQWYAVRLDPPD